MKGETMFARWLTLLGILAIVLVASGTGEPSRIEVLQANAMANPEVPLGDVEDAFNDAASPLVPDVRIG